MARFHSFLWLNRIPLCMYVYVYVCLCLKGIKGNITFQALYLHLHIPCSTTTSKMACGCAGTTPLEWDRTRLETLSSGSAIKNKIGTRVTIAMEKRGELRVEEISDHGWELWRGLHLFHKHWELIYLLTYKRPFWLAKNWPAKEVEIWWWGEWRREPPAWRLWVSEDRKRGSARRGENGVPEDMGKDHRLLGKNYQSLWRGKKHVIRLFTLRYYWQCVSSQRSFGIIIPDCQ